MDYYKFQIKCEATLSEILIAFMGEQPFDTFEENETGFDAYIPGNAATPETEEFLQHLQSQFDFSFEKTHLPSQNWNTIWETNFHPVIVDGFCGIRADFHPPIQQVKHELVINPKMAFGTGHHETTFMVIQLMEQIKFDGASVLDYGCGTGVLAILASRLGAASIDAVDIEMESFENTKENCRVNGVENVRAFCGRLDAVPSRSYDVILANINRNVILDSLPALTGLIQHGSLIVVSGFVKDDEALMANALASHHFDLLDTSRKHNWLAMKCKYSGVRTV